MTSGCMLLPLLLTHSYPGAYSEAACPQRDNARIRTFHDLAANADFPIGREAIDLGAWYGSPQELVHAPAPVNKCSIGAF
jgi:hypothetical protein